ncbi:Golgi membrane exchange factor (Ric1p-Rgp1p) subunit [Spiromyces aspiralis]|uniref:Golgi membrane exchange factor (Ric1p-Rgp1p) subunit n=1 Tax=Spiromyces aspiralis TaxID=68401 RepID=A0ACC1HYD7_9FUNG|nr:Golgi membrane exchange factor (Ric1p-Rgp1p) subunit [Spiromyces aspiralis]
MSRLKVATSLSQDGIYFAGSTITCHITFRNDPGSVYMSHPPSPSTPSLQVAKEQGMHSPSAGSSTSRQAVLSPSAVHRTENARQLAKSPRSNTVPMHSSPLNPNSARALGMHPQFSTSNVTADTTATDEREQADSPRRLRRLTYGDRLGDGSLRYQHDTGGPGHSPTVTPQPHRLRQSNLPAGQSTRPDMPSESGTSLDTDEASTGTDRQAVNTQPSKGRNPPSEASLVSYLSGFLRGINGSASATKSPSPALPPPMATEEGLDGVEYLALGVFKVRGTLRFIDAFFQGDVVASLVEQRAERGHMRSMSLLRGNPGPRGNKQPMGGGMQGWIPNDTASSSSQPLSLQRGDLKSVVVFETQPAIIFSEMNLRPGESETFKLEAELPESLPPTFRGKVARITYEVIIVVRKNMLDQRSHVIRLPIHVMPFVNSNGDLYRFSPWNAVLNANPPKVVSPPRSLTPSHGGDGIGNASSLLLPNHQRDSAGSGSDSDQDILQRLSSSEFLRSVLREISPVSGATGERPRVNSPTNNTIQGPASLVSRSILSACRTQAPKSFVLSHQNQRIVTVWLPTCSYQLGEVVLGKLDFHATTLPCYRVSVWLESIETPGASYKSQIRHYPDQWGCRIHGEYHEYCRALNRVGFSIPTTSAAAFPTFDATLFSNLWRLRIEILVAALSGPVPASGALPIQASISLSDDLLLKKRCQFPPIQTPQPPQPSVRRLSVGRPDHAYNHQALDLGPSTQAPRADLSLSSNPPSHLHGGSNGRRPRGQSFIAGGLPQLQASRDQSSGSLRQQRHSTFDPLIAGRSNTERRHYELPPMINTQILKCTVPLRMYPPARRRLSEPGVPSSRIPRYQRPQLLPLQLSSSSSQGQSTRNPYFNQPPHPSRQVLPSRGEFTISL